MDNENKENQTHYGRILILGLAVGLSTGLFLRSKKGKELTKEGKKDVHELQKELMKKWKETKQFSKAEFETIVKEMVEHYERTKHLAAEEVSEVQELLLSQWESLQDELMK